MWQSHNFSSIRNEKPGEIALVFRGEYHELKNRSQLQNRGKN